jgi:chitin disaccharide deacetylase
MTMYRRLVVNADDLGLTVGVNDGIFDAHELGILTSASLFANAPATADAVRRARQLPSLGIGAHLTLVDGAPTLPPERIPTLVTGDGRFPSSWKPFIVACLKGRVSLAEVALELTAQIERLHDFGLTLTHLDAHKHVHAYPPVFTVVAELAARFGVPVVRVPYEQASGWSRLSMSGGDGHERRTARRQALLNAAMWPWAQANYRTAASLALRTPGFIGRIHTGVLSRSTLTHALRAARSAVTELMVHPGYVDDALVRTGTRLLESRQRELHLLCGLEARALLVGERIDLVRHDLTHVVRRSLRHVS